MISQPFREEHELVRDALRKFVTHEITPNVQQWEREHSCPREIFKKMGDQGFLGLTFPETYGGSGLDAWATVVLTEEMARSNAGGLSMSIYAHTYLPLPLILALGTEEQKKEYLVPAIQGNKIAGLAITEPGAGSDVASIRTTAEDKGDHFLVNGSKTFITNGSIADFVILVTRTSENGLSLLLFDTKTEGFSANSIDDKLGMHSSDTGELFFENCKVPKSALLGELNKGFYYIMNNFQEERLLGAVMMVSIADWAFKKSLNYSKERSAFGRPISKFQTIRHKLASMATRIEVIKTFAYRAVEEYIALGPKAMNTISMAKVFCSEESSRIIDEAIQIHGGWGYMEEYGIARAWRDARLGTIGGGTTEIMYEILSKTLIEDVAHKNVVETRVEA
ncbi:MAG: acyl-CoA dehydrogenase family protein [Flavobacteriales bacterium]|nr:acyl-CoA dehydrogenase family protein [Flavobacteriales bacterium]